MDGSSFLPVSPLPALVGLMWWSVVKLLTYKVLKQCCLWCNVPQGWIRQFFQFLFSASPFFSRTQTYIQGRAWQAELSPVSLSSQSLSQPPEVCLPARQRQGLPGGPSGLQKQALVQVARRNPSMLSSVWISPHACVLRVFRDKKKWDPW